MIIQKSAKGLQFICKRNNRNYGFFLPIRFFSSANTLFVKFPMKLSIIKEYSFLKYSKLNLLFIFLLSIALNTGCKKTVILNDTSDTGPVTYVNPLMGSDSDYAFSNGNTYPAIALWFL